MIHQLRHLREYWYITPLCPDPPRRPPVDPPDLYRHPPDSPTRQSPVLPRLPGPADRPHPARPTGSRPTATARPAITTPTRSGGPAPDRPVIARPSPALPARPVPARPAPLPTRPSGSRLSGLLPPTGRHADSFPCGIRPHARGLPRDTSPYLAGPRTARGVPRPPARSPQSARELPHCLPSARPTRTSGPRPHLGPCTPSGPRPPLGFPLGSRSARRLQTIDIQRQGGLGRSNERSEQRLIFPTELRPAATTHSRQIQDS